MRRIQVDGGLPTKALQATLKRLQTEREKWDLVAISSEILESAERITVDLNIRSLDAIHLACASACQNKAIIASDFFVVVTATFQLVHVFVIMKIASGLDLTAISGMHRRGRRISVEKWRL